MAYDIWYTSAGRVMRGVTRAETQMQNKNYNFFIFWFLSCLQALQSPYDTDVVIPALSTRPPTSRTVHHKYLLC